MEVYNSADMTMASGNFALSSDLCHNIYLL